MFDIKLIIKLEINYPALGSHFLPELRPTQEFRLSSVPLPLLCVHLAEIHSCDTQLRGVSIQKKKVKEE